MEWIIGAIVLFFISKSLSKKKNNLDNGQFDEQQSDGLFIDLEKMLKNSRIKSLKKEKDLIEKRIEMEKALISKMEELSRKEEKTPLEHIAQAKAKADVLAMEIIKAQGRKKKDLEFKRSQEIENQKYWIRRILS